MPDPSLDAFTMLEDEPDYHKSGVSPTLRNHG